MYAQNPLTTELKQNYAQIKATVMKAADDMPDADYGFVPGPGSRTYGAAVAHIAGVQAMLCGMASGKEAPKIDENKGSKAEATAALKAAFDPLEPLKRRPAVGIQIREEIARRGATAGLACHDQTFRWLVDDANTRDRSRHSARVVGAGVVDDDDFVWRSALTKKGM